MMLASLHPDATCLSTAGRTKTVSTAVVALRQYSPRLCHLTAAVRVAGRRLQAAHSKTQSLWEQAQKLARLFKDFQSSRPKKNSAAKQQAQPAVTPATPASSSEPKEAVYLHVSSAAQPPTPSGSSVVIAPNPVPVMTSGCNSDMDAAPVNDATDSSAAVIEINADSMPTAVQAAQPMPVSGAVATQLEPAAGISPAEVPDTASFNPTPAGPNASVISEPAASTAAVGHSHEGLLKVTEEIAHPQAVDVADAGLHMPTLPALLKTTESVHTAATFPSAISKAGNSVIDGTPNTCKDDATAVPAVDSCRHGAQVGLVSTQPALLTDIHELPNLAAKLAAATAEARYNYLGAGLLYVVQQRQPHLAYKITGMLLQLDDEEVLWLLTDHAALCSKVQDAIHVLWTAHMNASAVLLSPSLQHAPPQHTLSEAEALELIQLPITAPLVAAIASEPASEGTVSEISKSVITPPASPSSTGRSVTSLLPDTQVAAVAVDALADTPTVQHAVTADADSQLNLTSSSAATLLTAASAVCVKREDRAWVGRAEGPPHTRTVAVGTDPEDSPIHLASSQQQVWLCNFLF